MLWMQILRPREDSPWLGLSSEYFGVLHVFPLSCAQFCKAAITEYEDVGPLAPKIMATRFL